MLTEYIYKYLESLGTKREALLIADLMDDGGYTLLFDDRYVCTVKNFTEDENKVTFIINLNTDMLSPDDFAKRYSDYKERLEMTPLAGRGYIFFAGDDIDLTLGLSLNMSLEGLESEDFNTFMDVLATSICYIGGDDKVEVNFNSIFKAPKDDSDYRALLETLNIDVATLYSNLNCLSVDNFSVRLLYNSTSNTLRLCNTFSDKVKEDEQIGILKSNPALGNNMAFTLTMDGHIALEQSLDLKFCTQDDFYKALVRQKKLFDNFLRMIRECLDMDNSTPSFEQLKMIY